ncbi:hypothetical protein [Croceicoccus mobilis]|uniref:Uncharacterized protein n=1 Tax=Croceicoccus mobilis TaxID=1703339 RepID=A0A916Z2R8_9SPHN|nr:hypothetical protein [Croceicoccus mobilis]GGD74039.1 hypothetical protein GCM10010990_24590 [Croceicoccus mobilis]
MALNYSIFPPAMSGRAGIGAVFNLVGMGDGPGGVHGVVALSADSGAIAGPCFLVLTADERQRVIVRRGAAVGADPDDTDMLLVADAPYGFELGAGNWYLRAKAA